VPVAAAVLADATSVPENTVFAEKVASMGFGTRGGKVFPAFGTAIALGFLR
jgi:hypothetical protein